jgi:hypothetical protein
MRHVAASPVATSPPCSVHTGKWNDCSRNISKVLEPGPLQCHVISLAAWMQWSASARIMASRKDLVGRARLSFLSD